MTNRIIDNRFIDKPEIGKLISPQTNQRAPIFNWYSYKHGFSKELAVLIIKDFGLNKGAWVLDPFCGSGTSLLTCKQTKINSLGIDILPFSILLSNVKTRNYNKQDLITELNGLRTQEYGDVSSIQLPDIPLVNKAFSPIVTRELINMKAKINRISDLVIKDFFNLAFLSILESVSNTRKQGGFLSIQDREVPSGRVEVLYYNKINSMLQDIPSSEYRQNNKNVSVKAKIGDARKIPTKRKFDAIITSPPYPNRHDYTRIYSLEMAFDFISNNQDLKSLRYNTLRSHVEARKIRNASNYNSPSIIDELLIKINKNGTNNPQVVDMLYGYFEDMYLVFIEMSRCLKERGQIGLVVSNVRFAGVSIPVDEILSTIGMQAGLTTREIWIARHRGNSSQQMSRYKRVPSRESVIIMEKVY